MRTSQAPFTPQRLLLALSLTGLVTPTHADDATDTIVVTGQAARIQSALDVQEARDAIVSVVHADGIGALPDTNVAEALQRVPGVSIERDQGEGRYIRVRGLGPDLNSVTINGATLPSPESGRRAVMLDTIPTPLIRSLEVQKTLMPEQDANSVGGTVEIKTLSAFDHAGTFAAFEVQGSHDGNTGQTSPKFDASWSDRFAAGKLGVAAGLSWEKRKFGSTNVETGGNWDLDGAMAQLEKFEQRDYLITRERLGAALDIDYRPLGDERYTARVLLTRYEDGEERQSTITSFASPLAAGEAGSAKISRALKTRDEIQEIRSLSLGAERKLADWKLKFAAGLSQSSEKEPEYLSGVEFAGKSSFAGVGFTDTARPALSGPDTRFDPALFTLSKAKAPQTDAEDREHNLRVDLARPLVLGEATVKLQFGGKLSRRDKEYDATEWAFKSLNKAPASLSSAQLALPAYLNGEVDWSLGRFGPRIDTRTVRALFAGIPHASYLDKTASTVEDYRIGEDIDAAYLQAGFDIGSLRWLAGVRYEGTHQQLDGTGQDGDDFQSASVSNRYRHWLPALHLRHDLDDATSVRAAWTNSLSRPTFEQLRPGYLIDDAEAEFGNPLLKPLESRNLDLGIERRLGKTGVVSAYLFHKQINHFIYNTDLAGTGIWKDFDSAATFANGDKASVRGVEFNYSQSLASLPGWLLSANASWVDSKASIGRVADGRYVSRNIPLPSASRRSANLAVGYETGPFSARIAANYKSAYLLEIGDVLDARRDSYVDAQTQWDLSASYRLSRRTQLVFEALNLRDEPYYVYQAERGRNVQFEQYGRTYKLGLKLAVY